MVRAPRRSQPCKSRRSRAQALVEMALVLPILFGIIIVLFQYAILFMSYLTLIHMTRDVGRWLAVHPNTQDADVIAYVVKDLPTSVMVPTVTQQGSGNPPNGGLNVYISPVCGTYNATTKRCMSGSNYSRPSGAQQTITLTYDAASRMFLPTTFQLGWLNVPMPLRYQTYTYHVMVEPE